MSIMKCILTKLEKNPDHHSEKPATNRLRYVMIQLVTYFVNLLVSTLAETDKSEYVDSRGNISDLHFGSSRLKSCPRHRLSLLMFLMIFLSSFTKFSVSYLTICPDCFCHIFVSHYSHLPQLSTLHI